MKCREVNHKICHHLCFTTNQYCSIDFRGTKFLTGQQNNGNTLPAAVQATMLCNIPVHDTINGGCYDGAQFKS
jgi:hypothetical protein